MKRKVVYLGISAGHIDLGHLNIIKEARKLGIIIVGLLTDRAICNYKNLPFMDYEQRKIVIENIKGVEKVIPQETLDYTLNLREIKPDYVCHSHEWKVGIQKQIKEKVIQVLKEWGGELVEIPYTQGISSIQLNTLKKIGIPPVIRLKKLRRLLYSKPLIRMLEAHSGLCGLIIEKLQYEDNGEIKEFDGIWFSSLTNSTVRGKPDIESVDLASRLQTINVILEVTTKPIIYDGDTGGKTEAFSFTVKTLERHGVSAIIIEDKIGLKRNSLYGTIVPQIQDGIENFSHKISFGKKSQLSNDFMIIARIESLILKKGIEDALQRANAYINAGADGIMIHSKEKKPDEILEFCDQYKEIDNKVPLVVVPTTFNDILEDKFLSSGVNIVIYANHLLRSAYPAMVETARSILKNSRSSEIEEKIMSIQDFLSIIPGNERFD